MKIDYVCPWVDGSDPEFQKLKKQYAPDGNNQRWECFDELKYSLRSIHLYAPWINRVFIITNGQVPRWLDQSKATIVTHQEIYRYPEHLPTFNSNSIEMHLHRIPELSNQFLYGNDDTFFGNHVKPSHFFDPDGKMLVNGQNTLRYADPDSHSSYVHGRNKALKLLQREFQGDFFLPDHQIRPLTKKLCLIGERKFSEDYRISSSNKFRGPGDLNIPALLPVLSVKLGLARQVKRDNIVFCDFGIAAFAKIKHFQPKMFCIQNVGRSSREVYQKYLDRLFPEPSPFEL